MKQALLSIFSVIFASGAALAADVEPRLQAGALSFSGGLGFTNATLTILGPDDFEAVETASRGLPVFRVRGGRMRDGFYQYTLSAATDEKIKIKKPIDNGRGGDARDYTLKPFHMSGIFEVSRGTIVPLKETKSGADLDGTE
ncbi:hypothetical protein AIOL_001388 [Candidatus Rhodobacter oscarellae]|uniref:Uncharacterized protein n=1 Tax=Candidatus Rhodobacter oscarellae TaxID=1675527 RepID=A0A0J9E3N0_9RHOB|nr:hypothetical protein [Candidatus Rhodobacter lobularis]KMW56434.1 hypothetical protein AIOL_001388 [Candidatus Rhodobacter lobularis]